MEVIISILISLGVLGTESVNSFTDKEIQEIYETEVNQKGGFSGDSGIYTWNEEE